MLILILLSCTNGPDSGDTATSDGMIGEVDAKAVTCKTSPSSKNCDGTDPHTTGCDASASTVASANLVRSTDNVVVGTVELRWSSVCKTNWARVNRTDKDTVDQTYGKVENTAGTTQQTGWATGTGVWSPQIYSPTTKARAFGMADESFADGQGITAWK